VKIGRATVLVVTLFVSGIGGCKSGSQAANPSGDSAPTSPTSIAPPSSASPADTAKAAALNAYDGMWRTFVTAAATADWQSSKLGDHATGIALTKLTRGLHSDHERGVVTKGEPTHTVVVSTIEPQTNPVRVVLSDCSDSSGALKYRADNGQLVDNAAGGRRLINGVVERQADGAWKVSDFGVHEVGTC
jgi:hypothetical protein